MGIAIKSSLGNLLKDIHAFKYFIENINLKIINITNLDLNELYNLPYNTSDPFDCLLFSQAITREFIFLSSDRQILTYKDILTII